MLLALSKWKIPRIILSYFYFALKFKLLYFYQYSMNDALRHTHTNTNRNVDEYVGIFYYFPCIIYLFFIILWTSQRNKWFKVSLCREKREEKNISEKFQVVLTFGAVTWLAETRHLTLENLICFNKFLNEHQKHVS